MQPAGTGEPNLAWVRIDTPLAPGELRQFCADLERLYRINPLLEFLEWRVVGPGRWHMGVRNLSNGQELATGLELAPTPQGLLVRYTQGLKDATELRVEPAGQRARLIITDRYPVMDAEEAARRAGEIDRSLVPWGQALHRYLRAYRRWRGLPGWGWYMRRVWQPMRPAARRIVALIWWLTLLEFLAFLFVLAIFVLASG
jgi:hypothetical protein